MYAAVRDAVAAFPVLLLRKKHALPVNALRRDGFPNNRFNSNVIFSTCVTVTTIMRLSDQI